MNLRIATDIHGLERVAPPGTRIRAFTQDAWPSRASRLRRLLGAALGSDYLIVHFSLFEVAVLSGLLTLIPFHKCRVVTLDFFIGTPSPILWPLFRWALNRVDRFLVYFRDFTVFEAKYGLDAARFHYIPFKINSIEIISRLEVSDCGYIFSGGRSRRDFATFFAAVESLGYPVKLITSSEADMNPHGSSLAGLSIPPCVEVLTNDASPEHFNSLLAGARLVVIPIKAGTTTQAGIGVYLQAMALRKCVIISSGLGVSDVLTEGQAIIVPAGFPQPLREMIELAWNNPGVNHRYADAGYRYARQLGGEDNLRRSILAALPDRP